MTNKLKETAELTSFVTFGIAIIGVLAVITQA